MAHPHLDLRGGSERLTSVLASELIEMGHDVGIVTASVDPEWFKTNNKVRVFWIKREVESGDLLTDSLLAVFHAIREAMLRLQPEKSLVVIQEPVYAALMKMASRREVPVAMYVHFPYDEEITDENLPEYLKRYRFPMLADRFVPVVDSIICNSRYTARAIWRHWRREAAVVYPPIPGFFLENPPEPDSERENIVLYVARTVPHKQQAALVKWFQKVRAKIPDAKLVLAGFTDPRHSHYHSEIKNAILAFDGVEFLGTVPDSKLLELYRSAKVYVHPRVGEHFGMAPIEAMSQGCPVVVRYPAGLCEVLKHGQGGYWARNEEQLIRYTEKILKMPHSEWSKLSRKAIKFATRFSPRKFTERVLSKL